MLPKPTIPYDWHTYIHAAYRGGGDGSALTARADTWAGQWGLGVGMSVLSGTGSRRDLGIALVGMHSVVDAGNSFGRFGVQLNAGITTRTTARSRIVDARAGAGLVTRLSPLFVSGQLWLGIDVVGRDPLDDAALRAGIGAGVRLTLHEYLERVGLQLHGRAAIEEKPALEVGLHYSTG